MSVHTLHPRIRLFVKAYAHELSAAAFIGGFVLDNLALPRVDSFASVTIVVLYLGVAAICVAFMGIVGERGKHPTLLSVTPFLPFVLQFVFGGLLSMTFVYYFRSASLFGSWFFLFLLAALIIGNEFLIDRYHRLELQMIVLFTLFFCVMIFFVPLAFHRFGMDTFFIAGAVSVAVILLFLSMLSLIAPKAVRESGKSVTLGVFGVFLVMTILYTSNVIPPIPLALRSAGVFHSVIRDVGGNYMLQGEHVPWYASYVPITLTYHHTPSEPIFVTSAIFAPTAFETTIVHEWQRFDATERKWTTQSRITFPISGGREEGYRGYTGKTTIAPGKWRVLVETPRGQILGQVTFVVVDVVDAPPLEQAVL